MEKKKKSKAVKLLIMMGVLAAGIIVFAITIGVVLTIVSKMKEEDDADSSSASRSESAEPSSGKTETEAEVAAETETAAMAMAVSASSPGEQLAEAVRLHNEGVTGSKEAVVRANRLFALWREEHPGNPVADAYHGSVMVLMSRDESNPLLRFQWAMRGLKLLDDAVEANPRDETIRMLRGSVSYHLPEAYFHRTETAIDDYILLIDGELRHPGTLDKQTYRQLIYELGEAYDRTRRPAEAEMCRSMIPVHSKSS